MAKKKRPTMADLMDASQKAFGGMVGKTSYERCATGVPFLDRILGGSINNGGIPWGAIVEVSGENATGKTTFCLTCGRYVLNHVPEEDGILILDYEHSMDRRYAWRGFGIKLDNSDPRVIYLQPFSIDDARKAFALYFGIAEEHGSCPIRLILIDSVAAMNPKKFLDGALDAGETGKDIGLKARELAKLFSEYSGQFEKFGVTCIFTNQIRSNIKMSQYEPGPDWDTTGGKAIKFYAWIRLLLKHKGFFKVKWWDPETGQDEQRNLFREVEVSSIKNKTAAPFLSDRLYIRHGGGFDNSMTAVIKGQKYGLFHPDSKNNATDKERHKQCYVTGDGRAGFTVWKYRVSEDDPWKCKVEDKKLPNGMRVVVKEPLLKAPTLIELADELKKAENEKAWKYLAREVLRHYLRDEDLFLKPEERAERHRELLDDLRAIQDAEDGQEAPEAPVVEEGPIEAPETLPGRDGVKGLRVSSPKDAPTDEEMKKFLADREKLQREALRKVRGEEAEAEVEEEVEGDLPEAETQSAEGASGDIDLEDLA